MAVGWSGPRVDPPTTANDNNPTVFMPANPEVGDVFKPEDLIPILDETAKVYGWASKSKCRPGHTKTPSFREETSALEPGTTTKWYAPGIGVVAEKAKQERLNPISSTLVSPE